MWQHCWVVEAANVWIAQLRNLQECRCCPVWFADLSVPSAQFVSFRVMMAKLPSCRMWHHAVWQMAANVSEDPAASSLYSSTRMLICLWSLNEYRRTQALRCKTLVLTWSCGKFRPCSTKIHKGLLLCISVMMGLTMAVRPKHVPLLNKNECFYNTAAVSVFIYGQFNSDDTSRYCTKGVNFTL